MITIKSELYSKKNSKQIFKNKKTGKHFITSSTKAKQNEKDLVKLLGDFKLKQEWYKMTQYRPYPLHIAFKIYRKTDRRFDYVNIIQGLLDAMQDAGYIPDDDANHVIPYFEPYEKDKDHPRVEIKILSYNKDLL